MEYFTPQKDEKIIWEAKPLPAYKWLLFFRSFFGLVVFAIIFGAWLGVLSFSTGIGAFAIFGIFFVIIAIVFPFAIASLVYSKEHYWVTSQRIIRKNGFIGYQLNSTPLERVSDVIISRSFVEMIFGVPSIHVQTLSGQYSVGKYGAEVAISGVKDPEKLQHDIFELVKKNRKTQKLGI